MSIASKIIQGLGINSKARKMARNKAVMLQEISFLIVKYVFSDGSFISVMGQHAIVGYGDKT